MDALVDSLLMEHRVIARAVEQAATRARSVGEPEEEAFRAYLRGLAGTLREHHAVEDALVFPLLDGLEHPAPREVLEGHHQELDVILDELEHCLTHWAGPKATRDVLQRLRWVWGPHAAMEEQFVFGPLSRVERPKATRTKTPEIRAFTLLHLRPEERAAASWWERKVALPWLWRANWSVLKPFLPYSP